MTRLSKVSSAANPISLSSLSVPGIARKETEEICSPNLSTSFCSSCLSRAASSAVVRPILRLTDAAGALSSATVGSNIVKIRYPTIRGSDGSVEWSISSICVYPADQSLLQRGIETVGLRRIAPRPPLAWDSHRLLALSRPARRERSVQVAGSTGEINRGQPRIEALPPGPCDLNSCLGCRRSRCRRERRKAKRCLNNQSQIAGEKVKKERKWRVRLRTTHFPGTRKAGRRQCRPNLLNVGLTYLLIFRDKIRA